MWGALVWGNFILFQIPSPFYRRERLNEVKPNVKPTYLRLFRASTAPYEIALIFDFGEGIDFPTAFLSPESLTGREVLGCSS
ncbi:MAG: hypothetical protein F6J93_15530 [Oscillatoria sp. SIO1A7]|nr:hypothetical protein [Oscillatoria sp. SIO1A7]